MKYSIDVISVKTVSINSNSRISAIALAQEAFPGHKAKYISDTEGKSSEIAICDCCDKPIFVNDPEIEALYQDDYGNRYCTACSTN